MCQYVLVSVCCAYVYACMNTELLCLCATAHPCSTLSPSLMPRTHIQAQTCPDIPCQRTFPLHRLLSGACQQIKGAKLTPYMEPSLQDAPLEFWTATRLSLFVVKMQSQMDDSMHTGMLHRMHACTRPSEFPTSWAIMGLSSYLLRPSNVCIQSSAHVCLSTSMPCNTCTLDEAEGMPEHA